MWVITREINEYNQDGAYFEAAYLNKPSKKQLRKLLPDLEEFCLDYLLMGGGRHDIEDEWYYLEELSEGQGVDHLFK